MPAEHSLLVNDQGKNERLKCYFSLLDGTRQELWVESSGLSMLPLFYRGVKVHIKTEIGDPQPGDIVVFHRMNKFIGHRVIQCDSSTGQYLTKGDTLFYFDAPCHKEEVLGLVDMVEKRGKQIAVLRDLDVARLSGYLGRLLETVLNWMPAWFKFLMYFGAFLPGMIFLRTRRLMSFKKILE
jgi:hypothetical protein